MSRLAEFLARATVEHIHKKAGGRFAKGYFIIDSVDPWGFRVWGGHHLNFEEMPRGARFDLESNGDSGDSWQTVGHLVVPRRYKDVIQRVDGGEDSLGAYVNVEFYPKYYPEGFSRYGKKIFHAAMASGIKHLLNVAYESS